MNKETLKEEMIALLDKYGYEAKIELTEKKRSLKLKDIIEEQRGLNGFILDTDGVSENTMTSLSNREYCTDQIKESSARKAMLFGQIQRIADYANRDWVADWGNRNQNKYIIIHLTEIEIDTFSYSNYGQPCFKSKELAEQAYNDNKEIFDEFFKL